MLKHVFLGLVGLLSLSISPAWADESSPVAGLVDPLSLRPEVGIASDNRNGVGSDRFFEVHAGTRQAAVGVPFKQSLPHLAGFEDSRIQIRNRHDAQSGNLVDLNAHASGGLTGQEGSAFENLGLVGKIDVEQNGILGRPTIDDERKISVAVGPAIVLAGRNCSLVTSALMMGQYATSRGISGSGISGDSRALLNIPSAHTALALEGRISWLRSGQGDEIDFEAIASARMGKHLELDWRGTQEHNGYSDPARWQLDTFHHYWGLSVR